MQNIQPSGTGRRWKNCGVHNSPKEVASVKNGEVDALVARASGSSQMSSHLKYQLISKAAFNVELT